MQFIRVGSVTLALALSGCANMDTPLGVSGAGRDAFGEAVREARLRQTISPEAGLREPPAPGIDAQAGVSAWRRYQESFRSPPPAAEVLGIGNSGR